jgi:uncharacterized protein (DUF2236 family)
MALSVQPDSIVRRIWGDADVVLLIFGGAAAEFALNRAVDWLFFTGKIPADPIGRFFSTVAYAQGIVFADQAQADRTLARINVIHGAVERQRDDRIPEWAYRDVLDMLVAYSERAFRMLYRPLTAEEQEELYDTFRRVGIALHIPDLPQDYSGWELARQRHLEEDLAFSPYTTALYAAYRRDLGPWRYTLLRQIQAMLVPERVHQLLDLPRLVWVRPAISLYPVLARLGFRSLIQRGLIPSQHLAAVQRLHAPSSKQKPAPHAKNRNSLTQSR